MRSIILVHNASLWRHTDDIKLSFHFWLYFNRAHDFIGIGAADFCCGNTSIPNEHQNRLNPKKWQRATRGERFWFAAAREPFAIGKLGKFSNLYYRYNGGWWHRIITTKYPSN